MIPPSMIAPFYSIIGWAGSRVLGLGLDRVSHFLTRRNATKKIVELFLQELRDCGVDDRQIKQKKYKKYLGKLVSDSEIRELIAKSFESSFEFDRTRIERIEQIWVAKYQPSGVPFPAAFDWDLLVEKYQVAVKELRKRDEKEQKNLQLEATETNTNAIKSTAPIPVGFDLPKYRKSLFASYGSLKLHTLGTDGQYQIKLWKMFIEQNVRESLPPSRFEIPQGDRQQLLKSGQLELNLNSEQVEQYRRQYLEKSAEPVLKAIERCQCAVIVGYPGSGKSTLLQYLALDWAEGKETPFPLLIELREYVNDRSPEKTFLDFLERGARADWKFNRHKLHEHLRTQPSLVMFDGLDEIFDPQDYEAVVDEIANFATQQYPNAKIIVTSRVIGYDPERLRGVKFQHFTLQELDRVQIEDFIDKWYQLALGEDPEKERLKQRMKEAIDNSPAIQNLADNPLLLTMMAILNRRESLPRNRVELYNQASRILLHNWDVDRKKLGLSLDAIGSPEKQAMLRAIAYEMQLGAKGLAANLIDAGRLKAILTGYLKREGFKEPRETAGRLIDQLRSRNYILCDRGADTYGFVHRTFLEYFCATEIVRQFEKERSLSPEQLRDNIFGQHWQDKTWHEVLRLICGLLEPKFAGQLIEFLMEREVDRADYLDNNRLDWEDEKDRKYAVKEAFLHLQLATECFAEIRNPLSIDLTAKKLKEKLKNEVESQSGILLNYQSTKLILYSIAEHYHQEPDILTWLQKIALTGNQYDRSRAVSAIAKYYHQEPDILTWLKNIDLNDPDKWVRRAAVKSIGEHYHTKSEILNWLQDRALNDREARVRSVAVESCAKYYIQVDGVFELLCQVASQDPYRGSSNFWNPRQTALKALVKHDIQRSEVIELLRDRSIQDPDEKLRKWANNQLKKIG
jgi:energy-coupling factor transporter ATP-binding protein EcfA2